MGATFNEEITRYVRTQLLAWLAEDMGTTSEYEFRAGMVLTPDAEFDREDFIHSYGHDGNCSCHLSPPCSSCVHPGNPLNQEEDSQCWIPVLKGYAQ